MRKFNLVLLLVLIGAILWARPAGAQEAQVPFNTVNMANPNVMFFIDNTGYMSRKVNDDPEGRKRWELITDVIAGKQIPISYAVSNKVSYPAYQPHYDLNTVGEYWVFDQVVGNTVTINYYEDQVMPRVIRLRKDSEGWFEPSAGGNYMIFVHLSDSARVTALLASDTTAPAITNLAAYFRSLGLSAAAINESLRWSDYYLNRETATGSVHFSPTDTSDNRVVFIGAQTVSGTTLTYEDALKRFYFYESTGAETGGDDNRIIVPLKRVGANLTAPWVSPSDGGAKSGLCYVTREKIKGKWVTTAFACYKPTVYTDPAATRFLVLSETTWGVGAEELFLNQATLSQWRAARTSAGDTLNGSASYYCQAENFVVWGDGPYINWSFNTDNQPLMDDLSNDAVPIYGATIGGATNRCVAANTGAFAYAAAPPTDAQIKGDLDASLLQVLSVDASVPYGNSVDEFILPGGNTRIDAYLKSSLNNATEHAWWCAQLAEFYPGYDCPDLPTWPGSISFDDPWYGGYYDHLYWDGAYQGAPGIMESFQNVNYGFATYETANVNDDACPNLDFAADSEGNCQVNDLVYNVATWGEYAAYNGTYPVSVINSDIRRYLREASASGSGNAMMASSFHSMWRYFYNVDLNFQDHALDTDPPGDVYTTEDLLVEGGVDVNTMYFDLGFPQAWNDGTKRHLIQCDPFYRNGCRRNYIIYLTGGRDATGERLKTAPSETSPLWGDSYFPNYVVDPKVDDVSIIAGGINPRTMSSSDQWEFAGQSKWIWALKDPDFINAYGYTNDFTGRNPQGSTAEEQSSGPFCRDVDKTDRIPYGVKTFFIGFGPGATNSNDQLALGLMAWATIMDPDDEEEVDYYMTASNEEELRAKLTTIMNAIMEGQFARAAPEISQLEQSIITAYFEVRGSYPLYQGHLLKWDLYGFTSGSTAAPVPVWDFADLIKDQAESGTRNIWTMIFDGSTAPPERFQFWGENVADNDPIIQVMDPNHVWWLDDTDVETVEAQAVIDLINGDNPDVLSGSKKIKSWLGPVYHSKPLIVGPPNTLSYSAFPDYAHHMLTHADRPSLIYVGTGYGLLHAIALEDDTDHGLTSGQEVYAFVPPGVQQYLPMLRRGTQPYGVDGSPVVRDVIFYPADGDTMDWRTVLMVGLAGGGTSYSILDITDVTNDGAEAEMAAHFHDDNLALTYSVPTIAPVNVKDSSNNAFTKWAAFFGGGLQEDQNLLQQDQGNYFYIMNVQDGSVFKKFLIPDISQIVTLRGDTTHPTFTYNTALGVNKNQVPGTPLLVDKDFDRDYDYAYFGDMQGRIWKANFSATIEEGTTAAAWTVCPFYDTADVNFNGVLETEEQLPASQRMPVYYTPDAARSYTNDLIIFFSTGNAEWTKAGDEVIPTRIYALVDPETTGCDYGETLPATINGDTVEWPLTLEPGEKPLTPIHIIGGKAIFKTFLPTVEIACTPGTTRLWTLNYLTGAAYVPGQPFVTTNPDGSAIGTTDISFDIGIGGGSNSEGVPQTFDIPIMPADPLSWGEGVTF